MSDSSWLSQPVLWQSSRDRELSTENTPYENWLITRKFSNWYTADWDYGLTTIYFFISAITLFTLLRMMPTWANKKAPRPGIFQRVAALQTYFASRQFKIQRLHYYSPSLGAIINIGACFVFVLVLMLAMTPYYWPGGFKLGHSPPIATRSGWISIAIMPFMVLLATKVNPIGLVVGISHEHLQVYHRWLAVMMYITSLVHTFPFIVVNMANGTMQETWSSDYLSYWTGIAALVPMTYLLVTSWGYFRNRYYETFKKLHFVVSGVFLVALFIHCDFILSSWDYFWATAVLYFVVWSARHIGLTLSRNGLNLKARFEVMPDRMVKVVIPCELNWRPGQHVIVRFLNTGIHAFSSHPFTISSVPSDGQMELLIRVHDGVTQKLLHLASRDKTSRVLVDGPYGGLTRSLRDFEHALILCGGGGASFAIPLLKDLVRGPRQKMICQRVTLVWAVANSDALSWLEEDLAAITKEADEFVQIALHVTGVEDVKKEASQSDTSLDLQVGRPNLPNIIKSACKSGTSVGIATCGPASFIFDCNNAVADAQLAVVSGQQNVDIYLHSEAFSW